MIDLIVKGGFFIYPIIICSIIALAVFLERIWVLRRKHIIPNEFIRQIEELVKKLSLKPTLLLVDGNGVLHPYGMGIASHVGVKLGMPTIGVAKSLLCGNLKNEIKSAGECSEVEYEGRLIGYALRSSSRAKRQIYISPGHKVSFDTAFKVVKRFCKYKLPEPIREAHALATQARDAARI